MSFKIHTPSAMNMTLRTIQKERVTPKVLNMNTNKIININNLINYIHMKIIKTKFTGYVWSYFGVQLTNY
jgi:hypothetical protein